MAGSSSASHEPNLPMNTVMHNLIRLTSSNYLIWKNQILPVLSFQNLLSHVDGSSLCPSPEISVGDKPSPNPAYLSWKTADQQAIIILHASLTEEAFSEIVGLNDARQIWLALEAAYCNSSVERIQVLRDQLRQLSKGTSSVADFGRRFKGLCDQLAAIGHPVEESDKTYWFLAGLGPSFETFSTAVRTSRSGIIFRDLLAQAEGHEIFLKSLHGSATPTVAFSAKSVTHPPSHPNRQTNSKLSSSLLSSSATLGDLDCLSENPILEDKQYFSESLVETKSHKKEEINSLKQSSSNSVNRINKCASTLTCTKCIPRSIMGSLSKHPRIASMRFSESTTSCILSPCIFINGSKRIAVACLSKKPSKRIESFRDHKENVIKFEERLASGARVIIHLESNDRSTFTR